MKIREVAAGVIALSVLPLSALAQNTGGIFPPMVDDGHASLQYRITYGAKSDRVAQRIHYQEAINDNFMWRGLFQTRHSEATPAEFQFAQAELFWDMSSKDAVWKTGVRFDARVRGTGESGLVGVHWTNQIQIAENWHVRGIVMTSYDIRREVAKGIGLQTRGNVFTQLANNIVLGVEFYNAYGTTDQLKPWDEQKHQIGPFAFIPVGSNWNVFAGLLVGVTSASETLDLRAWLTYNF